MTRGVAGDKWLFIPITYQVATRKMRDKHLSFLLMPCEAIK